MCASKITCSDVIGVVREAEEVRSVTQRSTSKELRKRDLHLVDRTNASIRLTLWGENVCLFVCFFVCVCVCVCVCVSLFHWLQAEKFDGSGHPVLVVRGCKVTDWNGASANFLLIFFPTPTHATPPPQDVRWESQATHKLSSTLHDQRRMFCEGGLMGWGRL